MQKYNIRSYEYLSNDFVLTHSTSTILEPEMATLWVHRSKKVKVIFSFFLSLIFFFVYYF